VSIFRIREDPVSQDPGDAGDILEDRVYLGAVGDSDYFTIPKDSVPALRRMLRFNEPSFRSLVLATRQSFWMEAGVVIGYIRCWRLTGT
jgi:hypothetical protein